MENNKELILKSGALCSSSNKGGDHNLRRGPTTSFCLHSTHYTLCLTTLGWLGVLADRYGHLPPRYCLASEPRVCGHKQTEQSNFLCHNTDYQLGGGSF